MDKVNAELLVRYRFKCPFTCLVRYLLGALSVLLLAGCYTPYGIPISIPVNKSASVFAVVDERQLVTMGAAYSRVEDPKIDWGEARTLATETCQKRHDMAHAEPRGGTRRECIKTLGSDCVSFAILGDYQCLP